MKSKRILSGIPVMAIPVIAWTMAFSASCLLASHAEAIRSTGGARTTAGLILSNTMNAAGDRAFRMADVYLHKGVGAHRKGAMEQGFFRSLHREVTPEHVAHLQGTDMKDIVPWLWFTTRLDPENVNARLVAAYILSRHVQRPDLARLTLAEGRWNNPSNYPIAFEDARIFLREKRTAEARRALDAAIAFWPHPLDPRNPQAAMDIASMRFYRSLLREAAGDAPGAMEDLEFLKSAAPGRFNTEERIRQLSRSHALPSPAHQAWIDTLNREDQHRVCDKHDHDEGGEHGRED